MRNLLADAKEPRMNALQTEGILRLIPIWSISNSFTYTAADFTISSAAKNLVYDIGDRRHDSRMPVVGKSLRRSVSQLVEQIYPKGSSNRFLRHPLFGKDERCAHHQRLPHRACDRNGQSGEFRSMARSGRAKIGNHWRLSTATRFTALENTSPPIVWDTITSALPGQGSSFTL